MPSWVKLHTPVMDCQGVPQVFDARVHDLGQRPRMLVHALYCKQRIRDKKKSNQPHELKDQQN
jgi:hypothetical protein